MKALPSGATNTFTGRSVAAGVIARRKVRAGRFPSPSERSSSRHAESRRPCPEPDAGQQPQRAPACVGSTLQAGRRGPSAARRVGRRTPPRVRRDAARRSGHSSGPEYPFRDRPRRGLSATNGTAGRCPRNSVHGVNNSQSRFAEASTTTVDAIAMAHLVVSAAAKPTTMNTTSGRANRACDGKSALLK